MVKLNFIFLNSESSQQQQQQAITAQLQADGVGGGEDPHRVTPIPEEMNAHHEAAIVEGKKTKDNDEEMHIIPYQTN